MNYLYNGVELPDINTVWTDKVTYPYAVIETIKDMAELPGYYYLILHSSPRVFDGEKHIYTEAGVVSLYHILCSSPELEEMAAAEGATMEEFAAMLNVGLDSYSHVWTINNVAGGYDDVGDPIMFWTSSPITNTSDNSIYLDASDPVPVGGAIPEYAIIPTADYKAACDAIRTKTGKTALIKSGDMASEIASVPTGGGGGGQVELIEGAVYKAQEERPGGVYVVNSAFAEGVMTIEEFFLTLSQVEVTTKLYCVDALPETMDVLDEAAFTIPIYIINSTGIGYMSQDGTSASAVTIGEGLLYAPDKGWVDNAESIDASVDGVYCVRGASGDVYYTYADGKFVFKSEVADTDTVITVDDATTYTSGDDVYLHDAKGWEKFVTPTPPEVLSYNVAFATEAPEDTSKLWVETDGKPTNIEVTTDNIDVPIVEILSTTLPIANADIAAAAVGTKIYLFSGLDSSSRGDIQMFDTEAKTVVTLDTKLIEERYHLGAVPVGTKIYLLGGYLGSTSTGLIYSDSISVFDTQTNTIEMLDIKLPAKSLNDWKSNAAVGTKIYMIRDKSVWVLDTETNAIETITDVLPIDFDRSLVVAVGTKIHIIGSKTIADNDYITVFDTETNTAEKLDTRLTYGYCEDESAVAIGTKIYLMSGTLGDKRIEVFDTETHKIETLKTELPEKIKQAGHAVVGNVAYYFGAYPKKDRIMSFTVPQAHYEANTAYLKASLTKNVFELLSPVESDQVISNNSLKIGVDGVYITDAEGYAGKVNAYLYNIGTEKWELI